MKYIYYISFATNDRFGYAEITFPREITTSEQIIDAQEKISGKGNLRGVVIINYILLRTEEA